MKAVVAYDSILGNTKKIAELIAKELEAKGHSVLLINLAERDATDIDGDVMFVGCPNRMKMVSSMARRYIRGIDRKRWQGKRAIAFDTVMQLPQGPNATEKQIAKASKWSYQGAAPKMSKMLEKKGLVCMDVWHFEVSGLKGPLVPGWEDKVKKCTTSF